MKLFHISQRRMRARAGIKHVRRKRGDKACWAAAIIGYGMAAALLLGWGAILLLLLG